MATLRVAASDLGRQLITGWKNLGTGRKIPIILAGVVVFAILMIVSYKAANPDYAILFSNLDPIDAAEVVQRLKEVGARYKLVDGGAAILVPQSEVYQRRLDLAAEGLPRGGVVGFEIFQQVSFGQTDFDRQVKYVMALQGELTRTIRQLEAVEDARVHVALPERSMFLREQGVPTASVVLMLKQGSTLLPSQVQGIAYLVARSVEGLHPEDVTVVDTRGNILSSPPVAEVAATGAGSGVLERLQIQQQVERDLENRIKSGLEAIYGRGNVITVVTVGLDFDATEETREQYEPAAEGGLIRSQTTEEVSDRLPLRAGTAGAAVNQLSGQLETGATALAEAMAVENQAERRTGTVVFEHNRTVSRRVAAPGRVTSLAAAVVINGNLTPEDEERVRTTIATIVAGKVEPGLMPAVSITSMPFRTRTPVLTEPLTQPALAWRANWPLWLGAVLFASLMVTLVVMMRRRRAAADYRLSQAMGAAQMAVALQEESEIVRQQQEIEALAKQRPDEFASLVRTWLAEEAH